MKKLVMFVLCAALMMASCAHGEQRMAVTRIVPVMEAPGAVPKITDDGYFVWEEGKPYPNAAIVYGNVVEVEPSKGAKGWVSVIDPENGSVLGHAPEEGLAIMPRYEKSEPIDWIVTTDAPELFLLPGKEGEGRELAAVALELIKGEVITSLGRYKDDGGWLLLRFGTHIDDEGGGSGIGDRFAWGRESDFTPASSFKFTTDKIDEALLPSKMRPRNTYDNNGLDELPAWAREAILKDGFAISAPIGDPDEWTDDMVAAAQSSAYAVDFITTDIMYHAHHKVFSNFLKDAERKVFAPRLGRVLDAARKALLDAKFADGSIMAGARARALDMVSVPLALLGGLDAGELSDAARSETDRINKAEAVTESLITNAREDYTQYKPRGHYATDATLSKYFRAMNFMGQAGLQLFEANTPQVDATATAAALITALGSSDEWKAFDPPIDALMGEPDDGRFVDFASVLEGRAKSLDDLASKDEKFFSDLALAFREKVGGPAIRDRMTGSISKEEELASRGVEFRMSGKRFNFDAYVYNSLTSPRVGTDELPRNLPAVSDIMSVLGSSAADEISSQWNDVKDYSANLAEMKSVRDKFISGDTAYEHWLRALAANFVDSGAKQFFYRSKAWGMKKLETAAASYAELKHDTVLYAKQSGAEMGDGDDYFAGRFAPPAPRSYVEPDPQTFKALGEAAASMRALIKEYGLDGDGDGSDYEHRFTTLEEMNATFERIARLEAEDAKITASDYVDIKLWKSSFGTWLILPPGADHVEDKDEIKMALVTDIATDFMGGRVLHIGVGRPSIIYVYAVDRSGGARVARGVVYNFYEFPRSMSEGRMTDQEWKKIVYDDERSKELEELRPTWHDASTRKN